MCFLCISIIHTDDDGNRSKKTKMSNDENVNVSGSGDKMSVFSDFQRMWVQRFPQSSLSDAWELDVRASLQRHKQKIDDLSKELEQETLYVEYLERLLSDVEKFREAGGDPSSVFDAANPTLAVQNKLKESPPIIPTSPAPVDNATDKTNAHSNANGSSVDEMSKDNVSEKDMTLLQMQLKDGALQQCITELSTNLRRGVNELLTNDSDEIADDSISMSTSTTATASLQATSQNATATAAPLASAPLTTSSSSSSSSSSSTNITNARNSHSDSNKVTASHFVTVIEVKEASLNNNVNVPSVTSDVTNASSVATAAMRDNSEPEHSEIVVAEKLDKFVSLPLAAVLEAKKKVPPRPPPKYIRRAAPVEPPTVPTFAGTTTQTKTESDSAPSSLERNIKPSEILRQKSSDSLDVKLASTYRKTTPDLSKQSDLATEFGQKIKADSLEKNRRPDIMKRTQSPTGSSAINSSPTGSLNKTSSTTISPNGSLGKVSNRAADSIGSRESLASHGPISERIKSYESISSISSDGTKVGAGIGTTDGHHHHHHQHQHHHYDNEPFYDTVPSDNGDGEYVYIQAGGTASTSSRDDISNAGSTLPMSAASSVAHPKSYSSQTSILTEPESPGRSSNYVNIDYFLSQKHETRSSSIDSDGESEAPPLMRAISHEDQQPSTPGVTRKLLGESNRSTLIRHIITSIISSETLYVECLNKMMQYMKAIRATLTTSQPVISEEEFQTMFFKIDELYTVHTHFLTNLRHKVAQDGDICVGETFRELAGHMNLYGAFLHNYGRAIDTVKKCGSNNHQFKEIVSKIVLNSQNEQSLTLEDLLHKPVARVQKNALVLQDLLNQTPASHPDYHNLKHSQKLVRTFLSEFNVIQTKSMFPSDDKSLRRLVKNSFIVELADGHRKLRHLFLFNDVIACAKYKASGRGRFDFELKWFIPLRDICVLEESSDPKEPKENSPVNILQLKSQACTVRDQILLEDRDEKKRAGDKHRKKLHDLEAQLVLASPNLVFRIGNKATNKTTIFFLSSDFERTQWIDSIMSLQHSCNLPGAQPTVNIYDLQAWIEACQTLIKTEMGSYLLRNSRDESLLVGDLCLNIQGLVGLEKAADLLICVEIDSYGHYFRKAKTKLVCCSASPLWNESFILELEGSQNVRILLYEDQSGRQILRAKYVIKLSRQWLKETPMNWPIRLSETITLNTTLQFVPGEVSLRRVPTSKPGALFGAKIQQVLKREKRDIPFILSACIREVERRGMGEIGIYRVSGSASDLARLKKSFESNNYEAEQLLKEVDIHSVTGILKSYLRELPEALFTDLQYPKLFEIFNRYNNFNEVSRTAALQDVFAELPLINRASINYIIEHLIRVSTQETENKMSLHNLAMVFGPTLLRPGPHGVKQKDLLESSTVDVMAQAGILYCFLQAKLK